LAVLVMIALVGSLSARAEGPGDASRTSAASDPLEAPFGRGRLNVGVSVGWGHGFERAEDPQDDVRMLAFMARTAVGLTDPVGGDAWYRGNVDLAIEPQFLANLDPEGGFAGGLSLLLRYHFLAGERLVPFVSGGGGAIGLDFDGQRQDDGFNFILQGGIGAHWMLSEQLAITVDGRWHHISNAGLRSPNEGIDSALGMVGLTWFLR